MCLQVYFCVAVFRYLEKNILKHVQEHNLLVFLKASKALDTLYQSSIIQHVAEVVSGMWSDCHYFTPCVFTEATRW